METKTAQTVLKRGEYEKLDEEAKKKGHTVSSLLRHLVKEFLKTVTNT